MSNLKRPLAAMLLTASGVVAAQQQSPEWQAYSPAAFEQAASQDRLILLDLIAVWCHWCHVMEATTYADRSVIDQIERHYVAVQADHDARPDLAERYRDYGWPATIILTADGRELVKRAGYIAPDKMAMLLQRVAHGADKMSAREALRIATRGGAEVLGRDDIGQIAPGKRADLAIWDVSGLESAGSWDKAALLLAGPTRVRDLFVEGRLVVRDGQVVSFDLGRAVARQDVLARALIG